MWLVDAVRRAARNDVNYRDDFTYTADLSEGWPLNNSSVDAIYAKDVFEHIDNASFPGNKGKIWVLNESYRVLKNGARLELLVPCVHMRDMTINPGAFADPTHVSFWTYDDRYYFTEEWNNPQGERGRLGPAYGITCRFRVVVWELQEYGGPGERRSKIHAVLEAVKP
jgi:SAM-dependent methyltransferase